MPWSGPANASASASGRGNQEAAMLSQQDNEFLVRTGRGTPMGNLMRRYWIPALLSWELPGPIATRCASDCWAKTWSRFATPTARSGCCRQLPASRRVAVLRPQRRKRLALRVPRLEVHRRRHVRRHAERAGRVGFRPKSRRRPIHAASAAGSSGSIWAPRGLQPELPDLEWSLVPEDRRLLSKREQETNYAQAMEGGIDSSHVSFLHRRSPAAAEQHAGRQVSAW